MPDLTTHRSLLNTVVLATITSLTLCAQSAGSNTGSDIGSIEGRVTNSVTGEAVGGVSVRFLDRHSYVYSTVTDSTGSYRFTGLNDGDYQGEFRKDGFIDNFGNPFSHVSGFVPVRVDTQLKPWATLRGRVLDEDLKPVAGVRVEKDPTPPGILDGVAVTDEKGEFVFQDLPPGSYTVVARPAAKIRMHDGVRLGTVAIYYPSTTEPAQAVRIPVRTGQNVSGIEIRLKSVPVHRVAGVVLNEAGKPEAHAMVKLMGQAGTTRQGIAAGMIMTGATVGANGFVRATSPPEIYTIIGPSPEPEVARVESHDDGTFEFAAVEPGDWRLSAEAGVADDMPLAGVASAPVSESDVEDIRIQLTSSFAVEVAWEDAQAAPASAGFASLSLCLTPVEGQSRVIVSDPARNVGKMNNVFPGRYRVTPGVIQAGFHVTAVMWEGRDVNGQVVELAPGAAPFQVMVNSAFGKVRGTVENGEGKTVFLISRESGEILSYRQVECRAGGAFKIGDVTPGDYYLVAFDRTESGGLPAADLLEAIMPIASSVRVEEGSTTSVDLRVNRWPW
jgi:hypothetical protein